MVVVRRDWGTLYYGCSEPVSDEPPFKVANAIDLVQREERYTVWASKQSMCVYITVPETELHVVLWSVGGHYSLVKKLSWVVNIVLVYVLRLALCAYLPIVLFWCAQVLLIWISECFFLTIDEQISLASPVNCKSCKLDSGKVCCIHCIEWIKEIVTFNFIFTGQW